MQALQDFLQKLDLHPVADHFTVALLIVAVLVDLVASITPAQAWLRHMALTLMVLAAVAAAASYFSGDLEADRVWDAISKDAQHVLGRHAEIGEYLTIAIAALAIWRILIAGLGFFSGTRFVYLILALIAAGTMIYQGYLGGMLVYEYGVGTALSPSPAPSSSATETPLPNFALPTVGTLPPTPMPTSAPSPIPAPSSGPPVGPSTAPSAAPSALPTA